MKLWRFKSGGSLPQLEPSTVAALPSTYAERLALFTVALAKERAPSLLEHLAAPAQAGARGAAQRLLNQSSAERHAALATEFGEAPGAARRVRCLLDEASPELAAEILKRLPAHHRAGAPCQDGGPASPLWVRLAERLVREALQ